MNRVFERGKSRVHVRPEGREPPRVAAVEVATVLHVVEAPTREEGTREKRGDDREENAVHLVQARVGHTGGLDAAVDCRVDADVSPGATRHMCGLGLVAICVPGTVIVHTGALYRRVIVELAVLICRLSLIRGNDLGVDECLGQYVHVIVGPVFLHARVQDARGCDVVAQPLVITCGGLGDLVWVLQLVRGGILHAGIRARRKDAEVGHRHSCLPSKGLAKLGLVGRQVTIPNPHILSA